MWNSKLWCSQRAIVKIVAFTNLSNIGPKFQTACLSAKTPRLFPFFFWLLGFFGHSQHGQWVRESLYTVWGRRGLWGFFFLGYFSVHNFVGLWQSQTSPIPLRHGLWLGLDCSCPKPCGWGAGQKKWGKCGSFWYSCFWEIRCPTISACGNARLFCHVYHHCLCNSKWISLCWNLMLHCHIKWK